MSNENYKGSSYFQAKAEMEIARLKAKSGKPTTQETDDLNNPNQSIQSPIQDQLQEHLRKLGRKNT